MVVKWQPLYAGNLSKVSLEGDCHGDSPYQPEWGRVDTAARNRMVASLCQLGGRGC